MFSVYKLANLIRRSTYSNKNHLITQNNKIINLTRKFFFKKSNTLFLAAGKKDYYSKFNL